MAVNRSKVTSKMTSEDNAFPRIPAVQMSPSKQYRRRESTHLDCSYHTIGKPEEIRPEISLRRFMFAFEKIVLM